MTEEQATYGEQRPRKRISPYRMLGAFVPNWLMERHEVSAGAKLLYARLAQHAYKKDHCWPGQATLVEEMGENLRQIQRYVAELRRCGLIETSDRGIGRSQVYSFLDHEWMSAYADKYGGSMPTNTADISESIVSDPPVTDSSSEESSSSGAREDDDFLSSLQDLYTDLPHGLRSPITAPAKFFAAVKENGSTIPRFDPEKVRTAAGLIHYALRPRRLQLPHPKEAAGLEDVLRVVDTHPKLHSPEGSGWIHFGHLKACIGEFLCSDGDEEGGELNPDTVLTRLARQPNKLRQVIDLSG